MRVLRYVVPADGKAGGRGAWRLAVYAFAFARMYMRVCLTQVQSVYVYAHTGGG